MCIFSFSLLRVARFRSALTGMLRIVFLMATSFSIQFRVAVFSCWLAVVAFPVLSKLKSGSWFDVNILYIVVLALCLSWVTYNTEREWKFRFFMETKNRPSFDAMDEALWEKRKQKFALDGPSRRRPATADDDTLTESQRARDDVDFSIKMTKLKLLSNATEALDPRYAPDEVQPAHTTKMIAVVVQAQPDIIEKAEDDEQLG